MLTEQEFIDQRNAEDPDFWYSNSRILQSCGHYNCQYHGLCTIVELRNILGAELRYQLRKTVRIPDEIIKQILFY